MVQDEQALTHFEIKVILLPQSSPALITVKLNSYCDHLKGSGKLRIFEIQEMYVNTDKFSKRTIHSLGPTS